MHMKIPADHGKNIQKGQSNLFKLIKTAYNKRVKHTNFGPSSVETVSVNT